MKGGKKGMKKGGKGKHDAMLAKKKMMWDEDMDEETKDKKMGWMNHAAGKKRDGGRKKHGGRKYGGRKQGFKAVDMFDVAFAMLPFEQFGAEDMWHKFDNYGFDDMGMDMWDEFDNYGFDGMGMDMWDEFDNYGFD